MAPSAIPSMTPAQLRDGIVVMSDKHEFMAVRQYVCGNCEQAWVQVHALTKVPPCPLCATPHDGQRFGEPNDSGGRDPELQRLDRILPNSN